MVEDDDKFWGDVPQLPPSVGFPGTSSGRGKSRVIDNVTPIDPRPRDPLPLAVSDDRTSVNVSDIVAKFNAGEELSDADIGVLGNRLIQDLLEKSGVDPTSFGALDPFITFGMEDILPDHSEEVKAMEALGIKNVEDSNVIFNLFRRYAILRCRAAVDCVRKYYENHQELPEKFIELFRSVFDTVVKYRLSFHDLEIDSAFESYALKHFILQGEGVIFFGKHDPPDPFTQRRLQRVFPQPKPRAPFNLGTMFVHGFGGNSGEVSGPEQTVKILVNGVHIRYLDLWEAIMAFDCKLDKQNGAPEDLSGVANVRSLVLSRIEKAFGGKLQVFVNGEEDPNFLERFLFHTRGGK